MDYCFRSMIVSAMYQSIVTKDPWREEPCRREALQQKRREKKREIAGDTGRDGFPSLRCGCCNPGSAGCRSQVWMKSLAGCLASLCFPLTPLSLSHSLTFYSAATDNSRRVMCCSVTGSTFCYEYVWKDGKAYACFVPPPLKLNAYPFGVHVRLGIKQSLGSLYVNAFKREKFAGTEKMHFTKVIREC